MNVIYGEKRNVSDSGIEPILPFYESKDLNDIKSEISLDDFELYASKRIELYIEIDNNRVKRDSNNGCDHDIQEKATVTNRNAEQDLISHFILRAAFSSNESDRRKFIERERRLFEFRMGDFSVDSLMKDQEVSSVDSKSMEAMFPNHNTSFKDVYYFVDFEKVPLLLSGRKVFLRDGKAYFTKEDAKHFLIYQFEQTLRDGLEHYASIQHQFQDPRFSNSLKQMTNIFMQNEVTVSSSLSWKNIPQLASQSFPPCMLQLYQRLSTRYHLYYDGREQLCRFLRGIGLSLEDCLMFFQTMFTQRISVDTFNKKYSYNIRYVYGKEGRRVPLSPFSCEGMVKSHPVGDQCHGCPFANLRSVELDKLLKSFHVDDSSRQEIMAFAIEHSYDKACRKYFEVQHGGLSGEGVASHPVTWFMRSRAFYEDKNEGKGK